MNEKAKKKEDKRGKIYMISKFVILFEGRTGSSYVTSVIRNHPNMIMRGENPWGWQPVVNLHYPKFLPKARYKLYWRKGLMNKRSQKQLEWTRNYFDTTYGMNVKAIGFKNKLHEIINHKAFAELLKEEGTKVFYMTRRNIIKQVVSTISARKLHKATGKWNLLEEKDRGSGYQLDMKEFKECLHEREELEARLAAFVEGLETPTSKIDYEELLLDEKGLFKRFYDFLEVPYKFLKGNLLKNVSDDLKKTIINFEDLYNTYRGTKYEAMVTEVLIK